MKRSNIVIFMVSQLFAGAVYAQQTARAAAPQELSLRATASGALMDQLEKRLTKDAQQELMRRQQEKKREAVDITFRGVAADEKARVWVTGVVTLSNQAAIAERNRKLAEIDQAIIALTKEKNQTSSRDNRMLFFDGFSAATLPFTLCGLFGPVDHPLVRIASLVLAGRLAYSAYTAYIARPRELKAIDEALDAEYQKRIVVPQAALTISPCSFNVHGHKPANWPEKNQQIVGQVQAHAATPDPVERKAS